jgi:hypothetical protein
MSSLWARTALVWFVAAVGLGYYMGVTEQFQFGPSHAHIGVLGWLSSGVFAALYAIMGERSPAGLAPGLHWAAHTLGTASMTVGLFAAIGLGYQSLMALVVVGSTLVVISVLGAAIMLWPRLSPGGRLTQS